MVDPTVALLLDWLKQHEDDLLADTQAILRIPSIESSPEPGAPYGKENRQALNWALAKAQSWGMKTTDLEGHIGYADFGQGERLVMSLGHLDVVPVGPGWKHEPFGAEIDGGYLYARGAVDDKGPTIASFYAMRAIQQCVPNLNARMRQAFGCNEESGFGCVARYMQTEEPPTFGIAPDSGWPCYYAEKGICDLVITGPLNEGSFALRHLEGGQRPNIVIDSMTATVSVDPAVRKFVEEKLEDAWDRNVRWLWEDNDLIIEAIGKAAHGSRPFLGDSAAIRIVRFLLEIAPLESQRYFSDWLSLMDLSGIGLGIHGRDPVSGDLTSNVGVITTTGNVLSILVNIRYPLDTTGPELQAKAEAAFSKLKTPFKVTIERDSSPLYFPVDHPMVKAICDIVAEESGEQKEPSVMGGGTYARAVPNTISIGTGWLGDGAAHETDERVKVEHLFRMSRIYVQILYRLATMPAQ
jgi:succinyl-diaminopimelate desuccinylase